MSKYSYERRGEQFLKSAAELLVERGQIKVLNLAGRCDYKMGILKDPNLPQGYLVWLDENPASSSAWVSLKVRWKGMDHNVSFNTVGHSYTDQPSNIIKAKYSEDEYESMKDIRYKLNEWFWGDLLRDACDVLGITKIVKRPGSFPEKIEGIEIEIIPTGTRIQLK